MKIEELHRVVVQGFASVNARLDSVDAGLTEKIDSGLAAVNQRIDALQIHMDGEARLRAQ